MNSGNGFGLECYYFLWIKRSAATIVVIRQVIFNFNVDYPLRKATWD